jgi:hypothetical protein
MISRDPTRISWVIICLLATTTAAGPALADEIPDFAGTVQPLRVEAGPLISPALGPIPRTEVFAAGGFLYRTRERGRATYSAFGTRAVLGGEYNPEWIDRRLGLGGSFVVFQSVHDHVDLPPVIDERTSFFDLGPLRLQAKLIAFKTRAGPLDLAITPFLRLGLPTDTSRQRRHRRMPIRRVLDDRVIEAPYFLIEPGAAAGGTIGPVSFFTHQAPVIAPIHDVQTHLLWSMRFGAGIRIVDVIEIAAEIGGLMRATEDFQEDRLNAWSVDPGLRLITGVLEWELAARFGITDEAHYPYGKVTAGFAVVWVPR